MKIIALLVLALAFVCTPVLAQTAPALTGDEDRRLRVYDYDPNRIVELHGTLGYQMMIAFAPDERIENVSIGDSLGWQVTPNRAATILFVKPIASHATTNMNVVTSRRVYSFALSDAQARGASNGDVIYRVSFRIPPPPETPATPALAPPRAYNFRYSFSGDTRLAPTRVFDDAHATYFQFDANADAPAIFILDGDQEEVANAQARGDFLVVDRTAGDFVLRYGRWRTVVHNDASPSASLTTLPRTGARR